jgi:murein DD-endopeptidase MepM/ murein hydrolase activator NlpD
VTAHVDFGKAFGTLQLAVQCADGTEDFYAHVSDRVAGGVNVKAGAKVGEVGDQGNVTGPHLHFERHTSQGPPWTCGFITDPSPSIEAPAAGAAMHQTTGVPAQTAKVRLSRMLFGVMDSGSVRRLQRTLNRHGVAGDPQLPITGNYLDRTDEAVRRCQQLHGFGQDTAKASFVGAGQPIICSATGSSSSTTSQTPRARRPLRPTRTRDATAKNQPPSARAVAGSVAGCGVGRCPRTAGRLAGCSAAEALASCTLLAAPFAVTAPCASKLVRRES